MTDESDYPPDDAPVTWGDLRRVVKLAVQYQNYALLFSVHGITSSLSSGEAKEDAQARADAAGKNASEKARELQSLVPEALDA